MAFRFLGTQTKRMYSFAVNPLLQGNATIVINGEVCVPTNNDGSLQRGYKGAVPPTDPYAFTIIPSPWEQV
jgi:hypothetical protein